MLFRKSIIEDIISRKYFLVNQERASVKGLSGGLIQRAARQF